MLTPAISICIPVYNGSEHLEVAMKSAIAQRFNHAFEILVVDDCSMDNSFELAQRLSQDSEIPIRVIRNESNLGLVGNWNACVKEAKGDWVKFLFQDDVLLPDCLQRMFDFGEHNNVPLVLCDREYFFGENVPAEQKVFLDEKLVRLSHSYHLPTVISVKELSAIFSKNYLQNILGEPIAGLFKRDLVNLIGFFNTDLKQIPDLEYWLRIGLNFGVGFIPDRLVKFRVHMNSASQTNAKSKASYLDRIILGHLLLESGQYQLYRNEIPKDALEKLYINALQHFIKRAGYFSLRKELSGRNSYKHFERLNPGVIERFKYIVKTWRSK